MRGFVRTVAVGLGLNPEEAVMRMLGEPPDTGEEGIRRAADARPWLPLVSALLAVLAAVGLAVWQWYARAPQTEAREDGPEIVYRRDAIRALTEAQQGSAVSAPGAAPAGESVGSPDGSDPD